MNLYGVSRPSYKVLSAKPQELFKAIEARQIRGGLAYLSRLELPELIEEDKLRQNYSIFNLIFIVKLNSCKSSSINQ